MLSTMKRFVSVRLRTATCRVSTVLSDALLLLTSLTLYVHTLAPTILPAPASRLPVIILVGA